MYKPLVLLCVVFCVIEARPSWQWLEPREGYVPVYIRPGDTPLEEINPDLAEAFHALSAGRSSSKHVDAAPDTPEPHELELHDAPEAHEAPKSHEAPESHEAPVAHEAHELHEAPESHEAPADSIDHRPYEKKALEKKTKKATEITKPVERS